MQPTPTSPQQIRQQLDRQLAERWPEACANRPWLGTVFATGLAMFDSLFDQGGIPYGQIVEISGAPCSGKTGFLYRLLSGLGRQETIAYVDYSGSFFPPAVAAAGLPLEQLLLITPGDLAAGLRSGELLFRQRRIAILVCDLAENNQALPMILLHRLRMEAIRARGLVLLLTRQTAGSISQVPGSMVALRLQVTTDTARCWQVTISRSRLCRQGTTITCPHTAMPGNPAGRLERIH